MERIAVLLAVEPRLFRDTLCQALEREPGLAVFAERPEPLGVLAALARSQARVVVISSPASGGVPPLATHLFAESPELVVVGICSESGRVHVHRQIIASEALPGASIERIVAAIRAEGVASATGRETNWLSGELQ